MCETNITCEITEEIRMKYGLADIRDITSFVDNLVNEVDAYKRIYRASERVINNIRSVLGLQPEQSIIEAITILKRNK